MIFWSFQDGFLGQVDEHLRFVVADPVDVFRGNHHLFAGKPMAGFDDQVTDRPGIAVDDEVGDVADFSIIGLDMVTAECLGTP